MWLILDGGGGDGGEVIGYWGEVGVVAGGGGGRGRGWRSCFTPRKYYEGAFSRPPP